MQQERAVRIFHGSRVLVLWCSLSATHLVAQSTFGAIDGKVTDASGATVAGAKIDALNQATGVRNTTSNGVGEYLF